MKKKYIYSTDRSLRCKITRDPILRNFIVLQLQKRWILGWINFGRKVSVTESESNDPNYRGPNPMILDSAMTSDTREIWNGGTLDIPNRVDQMFKEHDEIMSREKELQKRFDEI